MPKNPPQPPRAHPFLYQKDEHQENLPPCPTAQMVHDKLSARMVDMDEDINDLSKRITSTNALVMNIAGAFPNGDYVGHQRYHQLLIESLEEKRKLRIAIQEKTISGLVWLGILALGGLLWKGLVLWWATNIGGVVIPK